MNVRSVLDWLKVVLSLLFAGCLLDWDYSYYVVVRIAGMVGFGIIAVNEYLKGNKIAGLFWVAAAILVNPILKVSLGRELWNIVDIALAILLILSIFFPKKKRVEEEE